MDRGPKRDDRRRGDGPRDFDRRNGRKRSRSRSPPPRDRHGDRRRSRSPNRGSRRSPPPQSRRSNHDRDHQDRDHYKGRTRSRSPPNRKAPDSRRERTPPGRQPLDGRSTNGDSQKSQKPPVQRPEDMDMDDSSEMKMMQVMGFDRFRSTKNTKVPGNDKNYGVWKKKELEYRQYMNRPGGFNRPLSPTRYN